MTVRRTAACGLMAVATVLAVRTTTWTAVLAVWTTVWTAAAARQAGPPPLVGELILASYGGVTGAAIGTSAGETDSPRLLGGNRLLTVAPDVVSVSPDGNYLLVSPRDPYDRPEPAVSPDGRRRSRDERMLRSYMGGDAFARPVVLHQLVTGKATRLKNLRIACAAWAPDSRTFSFVSADGIGVFDIARSKTSKIAPAVRRKLAGASVSATTLASYGGSTEVFARQHCGPWIDNDSFAYRTRSAGLPWVSDDVGALRWPGDPGTAARLDAQFGSDSGAVVTMGKSPKPVELGDVTIHEVSPDGSRLLASRAASGDSIETFVGRLSSERVVVDAVVPPALSDCRMLAPAEDLVCLRLGEGHPQLALVTGDSFTETSNLAVPGLRDWLWIGDGRALVLQVLDDDRNSVAVADVDRGTLTPVLGHAQLTGLTSDVSGLRLVHWIAARRR